MSYTVDACVIARWFIPGEEYEDRALKIKDKYAKGEIELYAPTLIVYEVLNVIWKAFRAGKIDFKDAIAYCQEFKRISPKIVEISHIEKVLEIAIKEDITAYDSSYILAAMQTNTPLVTSDDRLYEKAAKYVKTIHLKEI